MDSAKMNGSESQISDASSCVGKDLPKEQLNGEKQRFPAEDLDAKHAVGKSDVGSSGTDDPKDGAEQLKSDDTGYDKVSETGDDDHLLFDNFDDEDNNKSTDSIDENIILDTTDSSIREPATDIKIDKSCDMGLTGSKNHEEEDLNDSYTTLHENSYSFNDESIIKLDCQTASNVRKDIILSDESCSVSDATELAPTNEQAKTADLKNGQMQNKSEEGTDTEIGECQVNAETEKGVPCGTTFSGELQVNKSDTEAKEGVKAENNRPISPESQLNDEPSNTSNKINEEKSIEIPDIEKLPQNNHILDGQVDACKDEIESNVDENGELQSKFDEGDTAEVNMGDNTDSKEKSLEIDLNQEEPQLDDKSEGGVNLDDTDEIDQSLDDPGDDKVQQDELEDQIRVDKTENKVSVEENSNGLELETELGEEKSKMDNVNLAKESSSTAEMEIEPQFNDKHEDGMSDTDELDQSSEIGEGEQVQNLDEVEDLEQTKNEASVEENSNPQIETEMDDPKLKIDNLEDDNLAKEKSEEMDIDLNQSDSQINDRPENEISKNDTEELNQEESLEIGEGEQAQNLDEGLEQTKNEASVEENSKNTQVETEMDYPKLKIDNLEDDNLAKENSEEMDIDLNQSEPQIDDQPDDKLRNNDKDELIREKSLEIGEGEQTKNEASINENSKTEMGEGELNLDANTGPKEGEAFSETGEDENSAKVETARLGEEGSKINLESNIEAKEVSPEMEDDLKQPESKETDGDISVAEGTVQKESTEIQEFAEETVQKKSTETQEINEETVQKESTEIQVVSEETVQKESTEIQEVAEETAQKESTEIQEVGGETVQKESTEIQDVTEETVQRESTEIQDVAEETVQKESTETQEDSDGKIEESHPMDIAQESDLVAKGDSNVVVAKEDDTSQLHIDKVVQRVLKELVAQAAGEEIEDVDLEDTRSVLYDLLTRADKASRVAKQTVEELAEKECKCEFCCAFEKENHELDLLQNQFESQRLSQDPIDIDVHITHDHSDDDSVGGGDFGTEADEDNFEDDSQMDLNITNVTSLVQTQLFEGEGEIRVTTTPPSRTFHQSSPSLPQTEVIMTQEGPRYVCSVCGHTFKTKKYLNSHMYGNHIEPPFKCQECGKGFILERKLRFHISFYHKKGPAVKQGIPGPSLPPGTIPPPEVLQVGTGCAMFRCTMCSKMFLKKRNYVQHVTLRHSNRLLAGPSTSNEPVQLVCKICSKVFGSTNAYKEHVQSHQSSRDQLYDAIRSKECRICGKVVLNGNFMRHMRSHQQGGGSPSDSSRVIGDSWECEVCRRKFSAPQSLKKHINTLHRNVRAMSCYECNLIFCYPGTYRKHVDYVHNRKQPQASQALLQTPPKLQTPTKVPDTPPEQVDDGIEHLCVLCRKLFPTILALNMHVRVMHPECACPYCQKVFDNARSRRAHSNTGRCKIASPPKLPNSPQNHNKKRRVCLVCGRGCSNYASLEDHLKSHPLGTLNCRQCKTSFANVDSIIHHYKTVHLGVVRPYVNRKSPFNSPPSTPFKSPAPLPKCSIPTVVYNGPIGAMLKPCSVTLTRVDEAERPVASRKRKRGSGFLFPLNLKRRKISPGSNISSPSGSKISSPGSSGVKEERKGSFKCGYCDKTYNWRMNLKRHLMEAHGLSSLEANDGIESVRRQEEQMPSELQKLMTEPSTSGEGDMSTVAFVCRCGKRYRYASELKRHQMSHRHGDTYKCNKCGKSFDNMLTLKSHQRTHSMDKVMVTVNGSDKIQCNQCGIFLNKESLRGHLLVHSGEKPFACEVCDRRFRRKDHLRVHKCVQNAKTNENQPRFNAPAASTSKAPENPVKIREEIPLPPKKIIAPIIIPEPEVVEKEVFSCQECDKTFRKKVDFINHKRNHEVRNMEKPGNSTKVQRISMPCTQCSKVLFSRFALAQHMKKAHPSPSTMTEQSPQGESTPASAQEEGGDDEIKVIFNKNGKRYKCPICPANFAVINYVMRHILTSHDNGGPLPGIKESDVYRCAHCGKGFIYPSDFKLHSETRCQTRQSMVYDQAQARKSLGLNDYQPEIQAQNSPEIIENEDNPGSPFQHQNFEEPEVQPMNFEEPVAFEHKWEANQVEDDVITLE